MSDEDWKPFDDSYEKRFYEALVGNSIIQHCWPNAGMLHAKGWLAPIMKKHEPMIRPCRCDECLQLTVTGVTSAATGE